MWEGFNEWYEGITGVWLKISQVHFYQKKTSTLEAA